MSADNLPTNNRAPRLFRFGAMGSWWLFPLVASACPICNTATGQQVRAGIFGNDFWSTLLVVISPFPVLLLALAAYQYDWLRFGKSDVKTAHSASTSEPDTHTS